ARLDPAVGELALATRDHAGGRVLAGAVPAGEATGGPAGRDGEDAAGDRRVAAAPVVLQLVVAPAAAAHLEAPVARVDGGAVELVAPDERPTLAVGGRGREEQSGSEGDTPQPGGGVDPPPGALGGRTPLVQHAALHSVDESMIFRGRPRRYV